MTTADWTTYYQTVPSSALDRVLWLESERMGHIMPVMTLDKLDKQRDVVKNEKRTGESRPYAKMYDYILRGLFPKGHPYRWNTIGSMEDLDQANLEDVKAWFTQYYGASNAVLTISGDVSNKQALALTKKYFGHIPAGDSVSRLQQKIPEKNS